MAKEPLWFQDAVIYELHVRAFHDSDGDGIGDFRGLAQKLDYLQDLGITAIWLLPFYPSPLRDDGYDIADYTNIHPEYGDLDSFKEFLDAAHARGLRVITELVINHTSDQHPWFQRARRSPPGSVERDFYVWNETPDRYSGARIIFKDFEASNWSYDNVAKSYFWHRFYSHQPDLNYDNPAVRAAILPIIDFWLGMGVDGLRLDAVPYLFEREGTNCENLPETHEYLKELRAYVDSKFPDRMLLAEANQWPEDAATYFGDGDECHMAFHFPLMPRLFMAMHTEDRFPIVDILQQTPAIPANCQWATFLRNHDELTLEMVTDEERDYMYRAYARDRRARINLGIRRRLAPLLGNNRRRIELMNGLLVSLPGTPVFYYGDEIGMGDNIFLGDRNGVRTPMQWSADRNAGFSRANPQRLYLPVIIDPEYHYEASNVEAQQENPNSLLWWNKRLLSLRQRNPAFRRRELRFLSPRNRKILAFLRGEGDACVLVVANLSRFVQYVEVDLSEFEGVVPVELFGMNPFPRIGKLPYLLTLGPHGFYFLSLPKRSEPEPVRREGADDGAAPLFRQVHHPDQLFQPARSTALRDLLFRHVSTSPQYAARRPKLRRIDIRDVLPLKLGAAEFRLILLDVEYGIGSAETLLVPLGFSTDESPLSDDNPRLARFGESGALSVYDATRDPSWCRAVLNLMTQTAVVHGIRGGELRTWRGSTLDEALLQDAARVPTICFEDQTNQSSMFGDRVVLKTYRAVEEGTHPEVETGQWLALQGTAGRTAPLLGVVEYRQRHREPMALALVHRFVPHESTAWQYALDDIGEFLERMAASSQPAPALPHHVSLGDLTPAPVGAADVLGGILSQMSLLGTRLAELHLDLAKQTELAAFTPDPFSMAYQRSLYQSIRGGTLELLDNIHSASMDWPEEERSTARRLVANEAQLLSHLRPLLDHPFGGCRTRIHADCRLDQVLFTGRDFVFIDFEGIPSVSLGERRLKRSPLRDVAGILRSLGYAALSTLMGIETSRGNLQGMVRAADQSGLVQWMEFWRVTVSHSLLSGYLAVEPVRELLPVHVGNTLRLLKILLVEGVIGDL